MKVNPLQLGLAEQSDWHCPTLLLAWNVRVVPVSTVPGAGPPGPTLPKAAQVRFGKRVTVVPVDNCRLRQSRIAPTASPASANASSQHLGRKSNIINPK